MTREERKYLILLAGAVALALAVELLAPEPLDWRPNYERDDDRPYGSEVVYGLLPDLFPGAPIRAVRLPPFVVLREGTLADASYLFVTPGFEPDPAEARALYAFAERGNRVFVAAERIGGLLADTLGLSFSVAPPEFTAEGALRDSARIHLVNPTLRQGGLTLRPGSARWHFDGVDTLRTTVLGADDEGRPNYVRVEVGQGAFFLHTVPLAFTNYHVLVPGGAAYLAGALAYLPVGEVLWDARYKPLRSEAATPLRFILQDPALTGAYWVLVVFVALFILFEARRRQRIIPVVAPPHNATLEFVETVGRLYFRHGDHANLAAKKIAYLMDYLRTHLRLPTHTHDADFLRRVAERAGIPLADVEALFATIEDVQQRPRLTEADLRRLNGRIEAFYHAAKR